MRNVFHKTSKYSKQEEGMGSTDKEIQPGERERNSQDESEGKFFCNQNVISRVEQDDGESWLE